MHARRLTAGRSSFRFAFLLLPLLAVAAQAANKAPQPSPAMWKLESADSKIYLLGSMHILPAKLVWKTPVIEKAMAEADVFVFETKLSDGQARIASGVFSRAMYLPEGKTLSGMLSSKGQAELKALARELHLDVNRIDRLRPGSALRVLKAAAAGDARIVPGVDIQIAQFSLQRQKPRRYFETAQFQSKMLVELDDVSSAHFERALTQVRDIRRSFDEIASLWVSGDAGKIETWQLQELGGLPQAREILLDRRNAAWVDEIPNMLREKRTFLVTVGAAHLVGQGSVIDLLCKRGLKPQRINTATGAASAACPAQVVAKN